MTSLGMSKKKLLLMLLTLVKVGGGVDHQRLFELFHGFLYFLGVPFKYQSFSLKEIVE